MSDAELVRLHLYPGMHFSGRYMQQLTGLPAGRLRAALHELNRDGVINQCDRTNWAFDSVYRGMGRYWRVRE